MTRKVFASKSKFAGSKIFKSESATKYGRGILSQARDKLDVKKKLVRLRSGNHKGM